MGKRITGAFDFRIEYGLGWRKLVPGNMVIQNYYTYTGHFQAFDFFDGGYSIVHSNDKGHSRLEYFIHGI